MIVRDDDDRRESETSSFLTLFFEGIVFDGIKITSENDEVLEMCRCF